MGRREGGIRPRRIFLVADATMARTSSQLGWVVLPSSTHPACFPHRNRTVRSGCVAHVTRFHTISNLTACSVMGIGGSVSRRFPPERIPATSRQQRIPPLC